MINDWSTYPKIHTLRNKGLVTGLIKGNQWGSSWWFQPPLKNMIVKLDHLPQFSGWKKKYFKPPARIRSRRPGDFRPFQKCQASKVHLSRAHERTQWRPPGCGAFQSSRPGLVLLADDVYPFKGVVKRRVWKRWWKMGVKHTIFPFLEEEKKSHRYFLVKISGSKAFFFGVVTGEKARSICYIFSLGRCRYYTTVYAKTCSFSGKNPQQDGLLRAKKTNRSDSRYRQPLFEWPKINTFHWRLFQPL